MLTSYERRKSGKREEHTPQAVTHMRNSSVKVRQTIIFDNGGGIEEMIWRYTLSSSFFFLFFFFALSFFFFSFGGERDES